MTLFSIAEDTVKDEGVCRQKMSLRSKKIRTHKPTPRLCLCCSWAWWVSWLPGPVARAEECFTGTCVSAARRGAWTPNPRRTSALLSVLHLLFDHHVLNMGLSSVQWGTGPAWWEGTGRCPFSWALKETDIRESQWCTNDYKLSRPWRKGL